jgi:hypothetical protein
MVRLFVSLVAVARVSTLHARVPPVAVALALPMTSNCL